MPALTALVFVAVVLGACGGGSSHGSSSGSVVYRWGVVGSNGKLGQLELGVPTPVPGITGKIVQVATSNSDGYALTSTGRVYAWGVDNYGELGYGKVTPYDTTAVQVELPAGLRIVALANPMPFDAGLAIDSSGHVWGWGLNATDDLCLSGLVHTRPQRLPLTDVTLATGARTHSLFDSHGRVYACGSGDAGEIGDGSTKSAVTPTPVVGLPSGGKVTALTSSWEGSGALLGDGDYYDWGYNAAGQLGDGSTTDRTEPVEVHLPGPAAEVFQGGSGADNGQSIALLRDGAVLMWGSNGRGQLGTGTEASSDVPVGVHLPQGVTVVAVSSGGYASYAIDRTGRLWAWGDDRNGQLGTVAQVRTESLPVDVGIHLAQVSSTAQNVAGLSDSS